MLYKNTINLGQEVAIMVFFKYQSVFWDTKEHHLKYRSCIFQYLLGYTLGEDGHQV